MPQKSIPLSNVDAAWYQMEDPTNLMMVTGLLQFKETVNIDIFRRIILERLVRPYARFRSVVTEGGTLPGALPRWEADPHFDLRYHVRHIALPGTGDKDVLQTLVGDLMSTPLDFSRAPWQVHLIENVEGGSAILVRVHHCIGDGISLIRVLLSVTGKDSKESLTIPVHKEKKKKSRLDALLKPAADALKTTQKVTEAVLKESRAVWNDPMHAVGLGLDAAVLAAKSAGATGKLLLMPSDPQTPFKGDLSLMKQAVWSQPVALADVKRIGRVTEGKVNDVLLTAMTGALRRYLIKQGTDVTDMNFRAVVPVNLRPLDGPIKLGNEFGLVFLSLPVGVEDPHERLMELKRRMDAIKDSPEAFIALGVLAMLGTSPTQAADQIINIFGTKATAVATNVPGPSDPIFLAGKEVSNLMFWVPQSGRLGIGISILSYAGQVTLGVAVDSGLIPDPEHIMDSFHEEFESLMTLVHQVEEEEEEV